VQKKLKDLGYNVLVVPEAPTMLFQSGAKINIGEMNSETLLNFQNTVIRFVVDLEDGIS